MEKLSNQQIMDAGLGDWRKLAQALHARYSIRDYNVSAGRLLGGKTFWNPHACGGASSAASHHLQEGKPQLLGTRAWNIPQAECVSQSSSEWSLGLFTFVSETMRDTRRLLQS